MFRQEIQINGATLSFETGKYAKQADGAVVVRMGDSVVLVTACAAGTPREGIDFLPLTVDYKEYTYASGRIPGGFFKREGKPSEKEVLTSRMIDRPIRPLFPSGWRHETQIIALVLSADANYDPDVLAITGASAALAISSIPFQKTIAGVRVGKVDGQYVINPTYEQRKKSSLDLILAGSKDAIVMVEAGAKEITEEEVVQALEAGHEAVKRIVDTIDAMAKQAGKPKREVQKKEVDRAFYREVEEKVLVPLSEAMRVRKKIESYSTVDQVLEDLIADIPEGEVQRKVEAKSIFKELKEKVLRDEVLEKRVRLDGRKFDEIRPIWSEVGLLPRVHGSAVFTRGETQALVTVTLGTSDDQQKIETVEGEVYRRFMLHYNFPPFSVGEVQFMRGPGRREVGHGALAERALLPVLPPRKRSRTRFASSRTFSSRTAPRRWPPFAAARCRCSTRAFRCAPRWRAWRWASSWTRKPANTRSCRTSPAPKITTATWTSRSPARPRASPRCRWTSRSPASPPASCGKRSNRRTAAACTSSTRCRRRSPPPAATSRPTRRASSRSRSPWTRSATSSGPDGKMIRSIIERTGVKIDVEDDGSVNVASADEAAAQKAIGIIQELTATAELNKTYMGKVQRITDFGAFVEIMPGTDGLLHVSEIANHRVKDVRDELKEGEQVMVKVINIDPTGKIRLSRKALLQDEGAAAGARKSE